MLFRIFLRASGNCVCLLSPNVLSQLWRWVVAATSPSNCTNPREAMEQMLTHTNSIQSQRLRGTRGIHPATNEPMTTKRHLLAILPGIMAIIFLCFASTGLHAQGYGTISGTVTDPSGAVDYGRQRDCHRSANRQPDEDNLGQGRPICLSDSSAFRLYAFGLRSRDLKPTRRRASCSKPTRRSP